MKIFIGYDFDDNPISVLMSTHREKVDIAWACMKDTPHHVEEIDPLNEDVGVHGTVFLLTSIEKECDDYSPISKSRTVFRKFKRGI